MGPYDQTQYNGSSWYGAVPTTTPTTAVNPGQYAQPPVRNAMNTGISQFAWITNPGVIDMWPIAPGGEMTFIDGENMKLYVKRVDEYNHPLKTKRFKLVEEVDEEPTANHNAPSFNMDELKQFIQSEIDRGVAARMNSMFSFNQAANKEADN